MKKIKLHARVTKEIEVTQEQAERLVNNLCGSVEHCNIEDIKKMFVEGISPGNYESGYIPVCWIEADLYQQDKNLYDYLEKNSSTPIDNDIDL